MRRTLKINYHWSKKKPQHFLLKVKTQSKLEVPLVLEKIWQNLTPNCSAAQNNRSIWYHGWEGWSRSHYPCTLLSGTGHLAPSPLLIKKKGLVYPVFFPKHTMSTPGPEHLTHVPHCPEFKQINVWLCCSRDCRPCLHTISVRGLSATATAFMQKMQECSETDPRCVLDRHKYLVVISIKSHLLWDYQYRREHKKSYTNPTLRSQICGLKEVALEAGFDRKILCHFTDGVEVSLRSSCGSEKFSTQYRE